MKRKYSLVILFLILAIFLSGCAGGGIVTPATDEAKIKSVINEYFLAINDQNWNKAKGYCVYESDRYYAVCQVEDLMTTAQILCPTVTINTVIEIFDVSIYGNYGEVYSYVYIIITHCGEYEITEGYSNLELQKIGNSWKLY